MTVDTPAVSRADAKRNREKVLAAAELLFATGGVAVTLDQIAKRAGVGTGTVYRHFPTKEALYEAVMNRRIRHLTDKAVQADRPGDSGRPFQEFLVYAMEHAVLNKSLCEVASTSADWRLRNDPTCVGAFQSALAKLLVKAQRAGAVRDDIDVDDVSALLPGYVAMVQHRGSITAAHKMAAILWDGLRPTHPVPPESAATETKRNSGETRNETHATAAKRNETLERRCQQCGKAMTGARTGRPAKYCGSACRLKAHRARGE